MNRIELMMHRREIAAFIKADPVSVTLTPHQRTKTPSGGWKSEALPPRQPQDVRLVPFKRRLTDVTSNNTAGEVTIVPYELIGNSDVEVARGDTFTWGDEQFKVEWVDIRRDVRVAAGVDYLGGDEANA